MSSSLWRRLFPRRARIGLVITATGCAAIAFVCIPSPLVLTHPAFQWSDRLRQAYLWFLGARVHGLPLSEVVFICGWGLILLGAVLMAKAPPDTKK
jgi:hypothetical protein